MEINLLERSIIEEIINYNEKRFPFIRDHLPYLRVKSREKTGVGMYINFEYLPTLDKVLKLKPINKDDVVLSSNKSLELDALQYGLNYELNITKGKIDFLELVTNGESWNGNYEVFYFID